MKKNFRFHDSASNAQGWSTSNDLDTNQIASIKDPDGSNAKREITSIPSPFARINLVKNAFKEVLNLGLDGNTIYHKMVSHALDIGEIFFNYSRFKDDIDIISWDPAVDLQQLLYSVDTSHKLLGETLSLFLDQDAADNNFGGMGALYLLNYKKGPNPLNIIGGTSPASLFFTSANDFHLNGFVSGNHQLLGNDYIGLHKRDEDYIKYLWSLKNSFPNFSSDFQYIDGYLNQVYKQLPESLKQQLNNLDNNFYNSLPVLNIDGGAVVVQILGHNLRQTPGKASFIQNNSGFRIAPEKAVNPGVPLPLVLPNNIINQSILYVSDNWDVKNKAPHIDPQPVNNRLLPFDKTQYPYLTISDFLEPVIIRIPHQIDDNYFETVGFDGEKGFLLPVKPLLFDYFPTSFIGGTNIQGQKNLEIQSLASGNVKVILRIPIQNGEVITFQRVYTNPVGIAHLPKYDESRNEGAILENNINLAITPFYVFPSGLTAEYNVGFYEADINPLFSNVKYNIKFIQNNNTEVSNVLQAHRRYKSEEIAEMISYKVDSNFEYIQVQNPYANGILIPKFARNVGGGTNKYLVAIDFGTSNTHVELLKLGNLPEPLSFVNNEHFHMATLVDGKQYDTPFLRYPIDDLLPKVIASDERFSFPQRTVMAFHNKINFNQPLFSMGNVAIPFKYEQEDFTLSTDVKTNLKWDPTATSALLMEKLFEQLIKMIRNKVLLNNGDINKTEIIWTFPASMLTYQLNTMNGQWQHLIEKYLGRSVQIYNICESLTPFYYYKNNVGLPDYNRPLVTIDIGGGTTDVAIFGNGNPILSTSYRFASEAIFGDHYNRNININGYINEYLHVLKDQLEQNNLSNFGHVCTSIKSTSGNSMDVINALFSIENNKEVKDKQVNIGFLQELKKDDHFRIIFLLFYYAQIYHLALLCKKRDIVIPEHIVFSGTASKLLNIVDSTVNKNVLTHITKHIFKEVFNASEDFKIKVHLSEKPKELTAKGGLYLMNHDIDMNSINEVLVTEESLVTSAHNSKYTQSNIERFEKETLESYDRFLTSFFTFNGNYSFSKNFNIANSIVAFTESFLRENQLNNLRAGIHDRLKDIQAPEKEEVSETYFFYPLIGSLGSLAFELSQMKKS